MIKKQLFCCSAVLLLIVCSKWHNYHVVANSETPIALQYDSLAQEELLQEDISGIRNTPYFASLSFADENLPLGDKQIERKMIRYLKKYASGRQRARLLQLNKVSALPKVASVLRQHGIPEDFKYIPLVESGFASGTTSHRGASGFWQFMPHTAKSFGLRVDSLVDERQDIEKSTVAAAKYIKALYREFKSWTLVAAAFNIGEGNLLRAINRQKEDNYFKLDLNKETGSYVYKLISVKETIENPKLHSNRTRSILLADATEEQPQNKL